MDINRANIEAMFQEFEILFSDSFNAFNDTNVLNRLTMVVPSTTKSTFHGWLNQIPDLREWIGDRHVENIESNNMTITNKKFEGTIEMEREEIEDDQHGLYTPLASYQGSRAAAYPDKLAVDELIGSPTWLGDDAAFFSAATRSYDGTSAITNYTTSALSETTFEAAIQAMQSYVGHSGLPLGVEPFALLVGPANRTTAFDICQNDFRAASAGSSVQNRNKGLVMPIVSSRLVGTQANYWYLMGKQGTIRGTVYQERMRPEFQRGRLDLDSEYVFKTDKFQWGVRMRGAAFLSLPHLIYAGIAA